MMESDVFRLPLVAHLSNSSYSAIYAQCSRIEKLSAPMILVEQLKDIYRRCMQVKPENAMEIYSILGNQLRPLIQEYKPLADLFYEKARDERTGFWSIHKCLEDKIFRSQWLDNPDPVIFSNLQAEISNACIQMISFVESIPVTSKRGRSPSLTFDAKNGIYEYGQRPMRASCKIPPKSKMFILSQKMMHPLVQVGDSKSWIDLFEDMYGVEPSANDDYKKIDQQVRLLAKNLGKKNIPCPLKFEGGRQGMVIRIL